MSDYADIWDALAQKVETIAGIRAVYAANATDSADLRYIPNDLPATPAAIVMEDEPEDDIISTGNQEVLQWRFQIRLFYSGADVAAAVREHALMKQRFADAFHSDNNLYGTCTFSRITSMGRLIDETINGKPYLSAPIRWMAVVRRTAVYTDS